MKGPELLTAAERPIRCGIFLFFFFEEFLQHRTKILLFHCIFMGNVIVLELVLEQHQRSSFSLCHNKSLFMWMCLLQIVSKIKLFFVYVFF